VFRCRDTTHHRHALRGALAIPEGACRIVDHRAAPGACTPSRHKEAWGGGVVDPGRGQTKKLLTEYVRRVAGSPVVWRVGRVSMFSFASALIVFDRGTVRCVHVVGSKGFFFFLRAF
jgi:hypothetical protein